MEYAAIQSVIRICGFEGFQIFGSPTLVMEISKISDDELRRNVMGFYTETVTDEIPLTAGIEARGAELQAGGLKFMDSLHAALAEAAGVDYLMTTDIKFEKVSARLGVKTKVINPITFLQEYFKWLQQST
jgi:predicted nucleic acid-binding protein